MYQGLEYVLLLCFSIPWTYAQITSNAAGVCRKEPLKCCVNYRRVGNECKECFPGSFGEKCIKTCPDGLYGKFCLEKCDCSNCSKIYGCTENSVLQGEPSKEDENIEWHTVAMFVSGSAGLCFIIGFAVYNKLRKLQKHQRNPKDVPDSNGQPQLNPSTSTMIAGEYIENFPISKEQHPSSKCHNLPEPFSSDGCIPKQVAFKNGSISQDAEITSENIYSHLNMDAMSYNTLNHTSESEKAPVIGMYSTSSQEVTSTENNISDKTESKSTSRQSFLHPVVALSKGDENAMTKDDRKQINNTTMKNTSEAAKSNIQNSEKFSTSLTKKVRTPSKREKLEKKTHVDEMSKMLEDFKPKTEELENNNSKASVLHRSSKKTKRKLLRYSFAPSTEIA
ncbi:uncharacterized protein LOC134256136 isoform X2 [Saccostrea cucullata]|uniref:uncharacterized protein LOC134256136 isoform X2 n=1 Tax=Saccostrea cuccullata TaxID=36930 RepID=UPI002ED41F51